MKPLVSILCAAYNHEKFIKKALDGMLMQETHFKFEILIHDDASIDATATIINEYQSKYPNIVFPILQKENQYSKGKDIVLDFMLPKAKGKYFALCEGDDYWIDPTKLQKQVDYLEMHEECELCIHNGIKVGVNNEELGEHIITKDHRQITCEEVIAGGGGFCLTNSIVGKCDSWRHISSFYRIYNLDYALQIYLASKGSVYCFSDKMSAYRIGVTDSWSDKFLKSSYDFRMLHEEKMILMLETFNYETNGCYFETLYPKILRAKTNKLLLEKNFKGLRMDPILSYVNQLRLREKVALVIKNCFPTVAIKLIRIIRKVKGHGI